MTRHLDWPDCYNARDLGGLPTADGRATRWGAVVRCDLLSRLNAAGQRAVIDYGVRTIVDLREPDQARDEPHVFMATRGVPNEPVYAIRPLESRHPHVSAQITAARTRSEAYCIILDHYAELITDAVRTVATAASGGVLIHCHAGKDRTGIVSALLLTVAGVSDELIAADYAESQARLWPLWERMVVDAGGEQNLDSWQKPTASPEMMSATLEHLRGRHGGVVRYLSDAGITNDELARLRARLVEP
jgi:protein-tyrosine phosphatase